MRRWKFFIVVLLLGWTTLAGEITMARLLAPTWGSGTVVWSFVIAVVLLAMALGYWIGGRMSDRHPQERALALWLLPGAFLLLSQPLLGKWLLRPEASGEFALFVLLGALGFFFLGAATPWSLRLLEDDPAHTGELAGKLFAFGTIGSFLGTISAALVLLPELGTSDTFFLLGGISLLAISLVWKWSALFLPLALLGALFWSPASKDTSILWEGESTEQHLRVRQIDGGARLLELDDGADVQSVWRPGEKLSGDLWDGPLYLWAAGGQAKPRSLLVLGNGAGTTATAWNHFYKEPVLGIELDGRVTELAEKYFGLRQGDGLRVKTGDARRELSREQSRWSTAFLDTYDANHIPFHLMTEEFFMELVEKVSDLLIVNLQPRGDLLRVAGRSSLRAFPFGALWKYSSGNYFVLLSTKPLQGGAILEKLPLIPKDLHKEARRAARELEPLPRRGPLWTDDRAPAERYSR